MTAAAALRHVATIGAVGMLVACGGGDGSAADDAVTITDAWSRTTPPGTTVGAVYFTATSDGDDALVGAAVDATIAATATLHMTATDGSGGTSMEALDSLAVPADGELVLEPTGNHVMLVDLAGPLEEGDSFDLTLTLETAGDETVTVEVRSEAP